MDSSSPDGSTTRSITSFDVDEPAQERIDRRLRYRIDPRPTAIIRSRIATFQQTFTPASTGTRNLIDSSYIGIVSPSKPLPDIDLPSTATTRRHDAWQRYQHVSYGTPGARICRFDIG
jgi:hypothetical protein